MKKWTTPEVETKLVKNTEAALYQAQKHDDQQYEVFDENGNSLGYMYGNASTNM